MRKLVVALFAFALSSGAFAQAIVGISLPDVATSLWPRERDAMSALLEEARLQSTRG